MQRWLRCVNGCMHAWHARTTSPSPTSCTGRSSGVPPGDRGMATRLRAVRACVTAAHVGGATDDTTPPIARRRGSATGCISAHTSVSAYGVSGACAATLQCAAPGGRAEHLHFAQLDSLDVAVSDPHARIRGRLRHRPLHALSAATRAAAVPSCQWSAGPDRPSSWAVVVAVVAVVVVGLGAQRMVPVQRGRVVVGRARPAGNDVCAGARSRRARAPARSAPQPARARTSATASDSPSTLPTAAPVTPCRRVCCRHTCASSLRMDAATPHA